MTPLINYSHLSLGRSLSTIEELVRDAKESGAEIVGLTDWHTMAGAPRFLAACDKAGIKGVVGVTVNVQVSEAEAGTLVFLANDDNGYRNLINVLNVAGEAGEGLGLPYSHSVPIDKLFGEGVVFDGITLLDGHEGSLSHVLVKSNLNQGWFNTIANKFPESSRLAVATPKAKHPAFDKVPIERRIETPVSFATKRNQIPLLKAYFEDTYMSSLPKEENQRLNVLSRLFDGNSMDTMATLGGNNVMPIESFSNRFEPLSVYHPDIKVKGIPKNTGVSFESALASAWPQFSARLNPEKRKAYKERLDNELAAIKNAGYIPYFDNIVYMKKWEESQGGHVMLRGSGVASLAFYVLGVTSIDPMREDRQLMFERFVDPERAGEPDVDVEFSKYTSFYTRLDKHLPGQVAIINDAKGVKSSDVLLNLVERALTQLSAMDESEKKAYRKAVSDLRKRVPTKKNNRAKPVDAWAQDVVAMMRNGGRLSERERHVVSAAKMMVSGRRAYSVSNSTAIIVPEGVDQLFSTYRAKKGTGTVNKVSLSKDDLLSTGLIKYDFLANRFFSRAVNVAEALNTDIYREADPNSPSISRVFDKRAYIGLTQLSSTVGPRLADIMKPRNLSELVALSALIRDGASQANLELAEHFLRSKYDNASTIKGSPLEKILGDTYGLLLYEEQLLRILMDKGGFSFNEADKLRSGLKKGSSEYIDKYRERFIQEAARQGREEGLSPEDALSQAEFCYAPIENKRNRFVFSKAHASAYMELGVIQCDQKCYAPALFYAEVYLDKTATFAFPEGKNGWQKIRKVGLYDILNEWQALGFNRHRHNAQHLVAAIANAMTREKKAAHPDPEYRKNVGEIVGELKEAIDNGAMDFIMPDGMDRNKLKAFVDHKMGKVPAPSVKSAPRDRRDVSGSKKPSSNENKMAQAGGDASQIKNTAMPINGRKGKIDFDTEILPGAFFDFLQREGIVKELRIERKSATQDSFKFSYATRGGQERQRNFVGTGLRPDAVSKQSPKWMTTVTEQGSRNAYPFLGLVAHLQNEIGFMGDIKIGTTDRNGLVKGQFVPLIKAFTGWLSRTQNKLYPMDIKSMTDYFEFDVTTSPIIPATQRSDRRYAHNMMMELLSESRAVSPELLNRWLDQGQIVFVKSALDAKNEDGKKKVTIDSPRKNKLYTNVLAVYRSVDPHTPLYDVPLVEGAAIGSRAYQKFIKKMVPDPARPDDPNAPKVLRGNKIDFGKTSKRAAALFGGVVNKGADTLWVTEAIIDTYSFCDMQHLIADYNNRNNASLPVAEENAISIRSAGGGVRLMEQMLGIQSLMTEKAGQFHKNGSPVYNVDFCQVQRRRVVEPLNEDKAKTGKQWLMDRTFVWVGDPKDSNEQTDFKRFRSLLHAFGLSADDIKARIITVPVEGSSATAREQAYHKAASHIKTQREQIISSDNLDVWLRGNELDVVANDTGFTVGVVKEELSRGPAFSTLPEDKRSALAAKLKACFETMTGAKGIGIAVDPDKGGEQDASFIRGVCESIGVPVKSLRPITCKQLPDALCGYVKDNELKDHNDYLTLVKGLQKGGDVGLADEMIRYYVQAFEPPRQSQDRAPQLLPGEDMKGGVVREPKMK